MQAMERHIHLDEREGESACVCKSTRNTSGIMKAVQTELRLDFMEIKSTNCCSYTHTLCARCVIFLSYGEFVSECVCHSFTHSSTTQSQKVISTVFVCMCATFFPILFRPVCLPAYLLVACVHLVVLRSGSLEHSFLFSIVLHLYFRAIFNDNHDTLQSHALNTNALTRIQVGYIGERACTWCDMDLVAHQPMSKQH